MKKLFLLLTMICLSLSVDAQTRRGGSSFGFNLGYAFDSEQATLGLDYRYSVTDEFRLNPGLTYLVKDDGLSAWMIDLNAHYVFKLSNFFGFYPLGGFSMSFWKAEAGNYSESCSRFGANVGLGAEIYATREFTLGLEARYNIIADFDQAMVGLRAAYCF